MNPIWSDKIIEGIMFSKQLAKSLASIFASLLSNETGRYELQLRVLSFLSRPNKEITAWRMVGGKDDDGD